MSDETTHDSAISAGTARLLAEHPEWDAFDRVENVTGWKREHLRTIVALLLYGEPFGFTQEDVAILRDAALEARASFLEHNDEAEGDARRDAVNSIAHRIAALLPPDGA